MPAVKRIDVVRNALAVVELLGREQPLGVSEMSRLLSLDKSGVQRILMTLNEAGWIRRTSAAPSQWETASLPRVLFAGQAQEWLRARARPALLRLREYTGETAMLAVLDGTQLLAVASEESAQPIRMALPYLPYAIPILGSSAGRAILSFLSLAERKHVLSGSLPDSERTALKAARASGWSTISEEAFPDTHSVAAALRSPSGTPFGALMVAAPAYRLPTDQMPFVGELVRKEADALSSS